MLNKEGVLSGCGCMIKMATGKLSMKIQGVVPIAYLGPIETYCSFYRGGSVLAENLFKSILQLGLYSIRCGGRVSRLQLGAKNSVISSASISYGKFFICSKPHSCKKKC